jgi:hypothetical protein
MGFAIYPSNTTTVPSSASIQQLAEIAGDGYVSVQPSGPVGVIVGGSSTSAMFNVPEANVRAEDDFQALYSASPTRSWFLVIASGASSVANTTAINGIVEILLEYEVEFEGLYTAVAAS